MTGFDEVQVGTELPGLRLPIQRADLVRYAGASGDFNPIHWSQETARAVGLPDVIAHGMLTMGLAIRVVTDWVGDPGAVLEYGVRFTRPVVVEYGAGTELAVAGTVRSLDPETRSAEVDLTCTVDGQTVLAKARARVSLR
jgi:acyl dehydratase